MGTGGTTFSSADHYRSWAESVLRSLPDVPGPGEVLTRTLGPRQAPTSGLGDVGDVGRELDRVALVGDSPLDASAALLRRARREVDGPSPRRLPVLLPAYRPPGGSGGSWGGQLASSLARAERLPAPGSELLVLVDGVRGDDPGSLALVEAVLSRWPDAAVAVGCDRPAALRLRSRGVRMAPCHRARPAAPGAPFPAEVAATWFLSPGDPLVCPLDHLPAAEVVSGVGAGIVHHPGLAAAVVHDVDAYVAGLARCFGHDPRVRRACLRLDRAQLASPVVPAVLDAGSRILLADEAGAARWLGQVLTSWEPGDELATARAAVAVGALADATLRSDQLHLLAGVDRELTGLGAQREPVLAAAADHAEMVGGLGSIAEGFDRCAAASRALDGARSWRDRYGFPPSVPQSLAIAPVTVAELEAFVSAGGYADRSLWPDAAEPVRAAGEPLHWPAQLRHPSRPVVGVSWYEAMAYAAWLSRASRQHWRVNAVADRRRVGDEVHPWGAAPAEPRRLNFDQHVGRATPVGTYPLGATPSGHVDLSGNVWEWCQDEPDGDSAVVMGGGWYTSADYVTTDYTFPFHRLNRFDDLGFRLALQ